MATVTIRNLPDEVHDRLKKQAKRNRRSLNQEVISELVEGQENNAASRERFVREILAESEAMSKAVERPMTKEEARMSVEKGRAGMRRANDLVDAMRSGMNGFLTEDEVAEAIRDGRR